MSKFRRDRFNDDVVVVRKKAKPKSVSTEKTEVRTSLPKKKESAGLDINVKVEVKSPTLVDKEKRGEQGKSIRDKGKKRRRIDPKVRSAVISQIDALLPEPPFKVGINKEILERLAGSFDVSRTLLRRVIDSYMNFVTRGKGYLEKAVKASYRYGLDGGKTEMTKEHREGAAVRLERIEAKINKRKSLGKKGKSDNRESVKPFVRKDNILSKKVVDMTGVRVHLYRDREQAKRTTISIESYLYALLAIHLGYLPDGKEARRVVTEWLQGRLFEEPYYDTGRSRISQHLKERVICELVGKDLYNKYMDWRLKDES